jgi:ABC-type phosphate transport system substrate-binding protein
VRYRLQTALLWSALLLAAATSLSAADPVAIVVHPESGIRSVTRSELSKIFLKRLRSWQDGTMAEPVDQRPNSETRRLFTRLVHRRDVVTIEVYWKRMIFSGRAVPPKEVATDREVLEFVRSTPGAVGYVSLSTSLRGVRTVALSE